MASTLGSAAALRQLAREFLSGLAQEEFVPESQREDLAGNGVHTIMWHNPTTMLIEVRAVPPGSGGPPQAD